MDKQQKIRLSTISPPRIQPKPAVQQVQSSGEGKMQNPTALPNTAQRVQRIQDTLASSIKAEFALVTERLNTSQNHSKKC